MGHVAIMHDYLVVRKKWISNSKFLHALNHCMILPGPEAQELAIYIGWKLHGKKGGLVAGSLFVLPSLFILLALSIIYVSFGNLPWIFAMFNGLKPAVIALIIVALLKVGQRALRGPLHFFMAAIAFISMFIFNVSLPLLMLSTLFVAIIVNSFRPSLFHNRHVIQTDEDEREYYINRYSNGPESGLKTRSASLLVSITLLLWFIPLPILYFLVADFHFWNGLALFFTKTAFVTIGGSYTVIPYVAQLAVYKLHWLTKSQMMDGFALAETTPGPLIIVLAFVGFMAGYNHFHASIWMGTIGLLATTFYTFLPCFLFVFLGAPVVEKTQGKPMIEGILGLVTAVVLGAILDLTLFLGKGVLFPKGTLTINSLDMISLTWVVLSLLLLKKFKINEMYLVLLSIAFGLAHYFVGLAIR
jgi:chromate transporter